DGHGVGLRGRRLNELDLVAGLEGHDRLLEVGGHARAAGPALLFLAGIILDVHAADGDLEGLFDGLGDGVLVGVPEHLKGVLAQLGTEFAGLLGEKHLFENLVGVHQFLPPVTWAMIVSSAFALTMIFLYWARSRVLSFAASCSETRSMLREARVVSAANGASTRSTRPLGAMRVTT